MIRMPKQSKSPRMQLSAWLDDFVRRRGVGRQVAMDALGAKLGCARSTLYQYMDGTREPGREVALRLLRVTGIEWM